MTYRLAIDGDGHEKKAWSLFVQSEFPSYESFWLRHVVPLTNRPAGIHFKDTAALTAEGKVDEDITIAQLHYTVLKHLLAVHQIKNAQSVDDLGLLVGLSCLTGAQDVAFELLERYTNRGKYNPWLESRTKGVKELSGQDAQDNWKRFDSYPLQHIRDYRNKLMHGRTPPAIIDALGVRVPAISVVDKYCDWRNVTDPTKASAIPPTDFAYAVTILESGWTETLRYLEAKWQQNLLP